MPAMGRPLVACCAISLAGPASFVAAEDPLDLNMTCDATGCISGTIAASDVSDVIFEAEVQDLMDPNVASVLKGWDVDLEDPNVASVLKGWDVDLESVGVAVEAPSMTDELNSSHEFASDEGEEVGAERPEKPDEVPVSVTEGVQVAPADEARDNPAAADASGLSNDTIPGISDQMPDDWSRSFDGAADEAATEVHIAHPEKQSGELARADGAEPQHSEQAGEMDVGGSGQPGGPAPPAGDEPEATEVASPAVEAPEPRNIGIERISTGAESSHVVTQQDLPRAVTSSRDGSNSPARVGALGALARKVKQGAAKPAGALSWFLKLLKDQGAPAPGAPPKGASPKEASCEAHAACVSLGLAGDCCPTADGVSLWCCS